MGPKKCATAAERQHRPSTTTQIAKKRPGSASNSPASRKITATPKKNIGRTPSPKKGQQQLQLNKEKSKSDKELEEKRGTRTPSREKLKKVTQSVDESSKPVIASSSGTNSKTKADTKQPETKNEKKKAISKMLKSLDIKISGFDNLLPKEERMSDGLKSSISENVKTKSRAAAVKVITGLSPLKLHEKKVREKLKKIHKVSLKEKTKTKTNMNTQKESQETKNSKSAESSKKESPMSANTADTKKKLGAKNMKTNKLEQVKKAVSKTEESLNFKKVLDKKSNVTRELNDPKKKVTKVATKINKKIDETKSQKEEQKAENLSLKVEDKSLAKADEKEDKSSSKSVDVAKTSNENKEKSDNHANKTKTLEMSPKKGASPKILSPKNIGKCNINSKDMEKEEVLSIVLDSNTEVVRMDIEEFPERLETKSLSKQVEQCNDSSAENTSSEIKEKEKCSDKGNTTTSDKDGKKKMCQFDDEKLSNNKTETRIKKNADTDDTAKVEGVSKVEETASTISKTESASCENNPENKDKTPTIKNRFQHKFKTDHINKMKILKTLKKSKTNNETVQKIENKVKSETKSGELKDVYDFNSGSEEEDNIKMELPILKDLRDFSDDDNKPLKMHLKEEVTKAAKTDNTNKDTSSIKNKSDTSELKDEIESSKPNNKSLETEKKTTETKKSSLNPKTKIVPKKLEQKMKTVTKKSVISVKKKSAVMNKKAIKKIGKGAKKAILIKSASSAQSSDSEDEKKLITFGQKRHRMASLNALAKVQCLYENESRTAYELGLSKATQLPPKIRTVDGTDDEKEKEKEKEKDKDKDKEKIKEEKIKTKTDEKSKKDNKTEQPTKSKQNEKESEDEPEVEPKRAIRTVAGGRGFGKHWEFDSDSENDEFERIKLKKKKLQKKAQIKKEIEKEKNIQKEKEQKTQETDDNKDKKEKETKKETIRVKRKYTKIKKPLKKMIKLQTGTSDDGNSESSEHEHNTKEKEKDKEKDKDKDKDKNKEVEKDKIKQNKNKVEIKKPPKKRKRIFKEDLIGDYKGILARKRMASLNASAIVAATYEVERHLDKNLAYCSSYESYDETDKTTHAKKTKETAKETKKASTAIDVGTKDSASDSVKDLKTHNINEESNDSKYSKETKETNTDTTTTAGFRDSSSTKDGKESSRPTSSSVVIVQDTDVTITGVYVNSTTGSSQESYCKMQYRVQSSVTEERVLRPSSVEPPKSYTPLSALSSMLPPGASTGSSLGDAHTSPPPPPTVSAGALNDPISASIYHATELGIHTEHAPPDHGAPPPSYAAAVYHAHHMAPTAAGLHHHQYAHSHTHQYQQANEHALHGHGPPPPPPHHYQAPPHYPPQQPQQTGPSTQQTAPHSTLSMTAGSGTSAFCAPNIHHQQQQQQSLTATQQNQQTQQQHDSSGYYQPAGPLISPHVLPPVAVAPPLPPPPNVPHLSSSSTKKQQIPTPLGSDPEHLPPQSGTSADSADGDVLITGGDLTPFRYPPPQSGSSSGTTTTSHHQTSAAQSQHQQQQCDNLLRYFQGSQRPMHAQMHYSTAYPPNYYSPYPGEAMCYSPPAYQTYFPSKVYQSAPPPPPPSAYRRYTFYQPGPPHPPSVELYDQAPPPPSASSGQAGPPPTQPPPPPTGTQLVPAGPAAHTQHLEHYPGPPGYYTSYSPGGGATGQCYTRSIQGPYMEYPQCPCPMPQSCPKNVNTGPHTGSNKSGNNLSSSNNGSALTSNEKNNSNNKIMNISKMSNNNNNTSMNQKNVNDQLNNIIVNGNSKKISNTITINNNSSNHQNCSSNVNNNTNNNGISNDITLSTGRGPVKNIIPSAVTNTIATTQATLNIEQLKQHDNTIEVLDEHHLDLLQSVKSELNTDDSDNKSQYEENVVQPPTPPESYGTNDEKLLEPFEKDVVTTISLEERLEEAIDKLPIGNKNTDNITGNIEAYDLTTTTRTTTLTATTAPPTVTANPMPIVQQQLPLIGRKARIGKSMAREMVYAGVAAQQPALHVRALANQHSAAAASTPNVVSTYARSTNPPNLTQVPILSASQTQAATKCNAGNASPLTTSQAPLVLKAEIKTEKIKIEEEDLEAILQQPIQLTQNAPELKIKEEPITDSEVTNASEQTVTKNGLSECVLQTNSSSEEVVPTIVPRPAGRMRLLPSLQHPPTINCDVDLSTTSDDDVLDLCHSPLNSIGNGHKRIKILEFNKNQCKKSPPNSYKNLIKQAKPRTYLCLSRKADKRHRYGKLQGRFSKTSSGNINVKRRQLILTEQQKQRLLLRKKKLKALERCKEEAREKKREAARQKRLERKKATEAALQAVVKEEIAEEVETDSDVIINLTTEHVDRAINQGSVENVAPTLSISQQLKLKCLSQQSPTTSPKRSKLKKPIVQSHVNDTIDAVARGYFSEPETRVINNSRICTADDYGDDTKVATERKQKKTKKSNTEKRSKSETKKPLKKRLIAAELIGFEISKMQQTPNGIHDSAGVGNIDVQLNNSHVGFGTKSTDGSSIDSINCLESKKKQTKTVSKSKQITKVKATKIKNETKSKKLGLNNTSTSTKSRKLKKQTNKKSKNSNVVQLKETALSPLSPPSPVITNINSTYTNSQLSSTDVSNIVHDNTESSSTPDLVMTNAEDMQLHETNNNEYVKTPTIEQQAKNQDNNLALEEEAEMEQVPENRLDVDTPSTTPKPNVDVVSTHAVISTTTTAATAPQLSLHSDTSVFLPPAPPMTRVICQHVATKRSRSRSKFGVRKRPKLRHSTVSFELDDTLPPATRGDVVPKWNNGWTWEGEPFQGAVFLNSDDPHVIRTCYPAMRHSEGDIIRTRDCVLLKANEENELPYVAKVAHLWENPEDGEMMMSLLWYYRPEHTEQGRQYNDSPEEVYASRHRDHNSVACIEDKCYVLTFSEYCRYRRRLRATEEEMEDISIVPKRPNYYSTPTVPDNTSPELVMFCRRAYEFRMKRLLKTPSKQDYIVVRT
ncbi:uncharacterized protein LOC119669602 [Teleopsis dalmanni]|uniref:uncharacterized protein LOC119669602 n=1 Tax=Teleopsis dalmanni TaxID=139649 RepID=UPI0018CDB9C2|nr:uncharacterized protein LOC119669602 [Teleopsis dalmanni]